jgi:hypothetical protein
MSRMARTCATALAVERRTYSFGSLVRSAAAASNVMPCGT